MTLTERRTPDAALQLAYRGLASTGTGAHLSEDDWVRLAADELDPATKARCADHVERCRDCAEVFRAVAAVRDGAAAFDPGAPRAVPSGWWSPRVWVGLAAAATLALAVAPWLTSQAGRIGGPDTTARSADTTSAPVVSAPGPDSAPPADSPPALRAWAELSDAPAVTLPATLALEVRGAPADRNTFLSAFGPAIAPYREGRYAEAAVALAPVAERFEAIPETWFYLGVSQLYAGRPGEAVDALGRASASDAVGAQATWLRVVALERAGRVAAASAALADFCRSAAAATQRAACASLTPTP